MSRITRLTRSVVPCVLALSLAIPAALLGACTSPDVPSPSESGDAAGAETTYPLTITDDAGRSVTIPAEPKRIVSLAPANTEMVFALGAGDRVVGVTSHDDFPAEVADIEKVGDFAGPNLEAVAAADPDLVLATTGVQADVLVQLEQLGATVIAIDPQSIDAVLDDIVIISRVLNEVRAGEGLVASIRADLARVRAAVEGREPVTVFVEIAQNPLFTAGSGTLIDELVSRAGGTNVVAAEGWVPYSTEEVLKADPDVYLATRGSMSDPAELEARPGFAGLKAVKEGRVAILDDNLVSRPGPRVVEGVRMIAAALHPEAFSD
jgi:iron complex transport system substrate-binding protein